MTKKALDLPKRGAMLTHINVREEKHGDDSVPAVDIKLTGIMLDKAELNSLLHEKLAHDALFVAAAKGSPAEPLFKYFGALTFDQKYEGCEATLYLGIENSEYPLEDVKIGSITLEPCTGGLTSMNCRLQHELEDTEILARLADQLGRECSVSLTFGQLDEGDKKQKQLPLSDKSQGADKPVNKFGEGEQPPSTH